MELKSVFANWLTVFDLKNPHAHLIVSNTYVTTVFSNEGSATVQVLCTYFYCQVTLNT